MKQLFKSHPYATSGFVLACVVTLFFMVRIVASGIYWADPAHHNETVKPWMTVGYIAKSWKLDPREIDAAAGLPSPEGHGPWTMKEIAKSRGVEVDAVIKQVNDTIAILQLKKVVE
jgi:hypothetical protein